uniref:Bidirectional sugar transporter SWEET n=1 Tax=Strombidinopsis acuminata TaxID=141414 RepID=A0A7S3RZ08_9SPIT
MPGFVKTTMLVAGGAAAAVTWPLATAFATVAPATTRVAKPRLAGAPSALKVGGPEQQDGLLLAGGRASALRGAGARGRERTVKVPTRAVLGGDVLGDLEFILPHILPSIAIGSSLAQQLSPLKSVMQMMEDKSVGEQESLPFVTLAFACGHWCLYGLLGWLIAGDTSMLTMVYANVFGSLLGLFYAGVFQRTCTDDVELGKLDGYWKIVAGILACESAFAFLLNSGAAALSLFGWGSTLLSVCLALAPLAALPTILETRSAGGMPKDLILVSLLSSVVWLLTGLSMNDQFIVATNAVTIAVGCINVLIMVMFDSPPTVEPTQMFGSPQQLLQPKVVRSAQFYEPTIVALRQDC